MNLKRSIAGCIASLALGLSSYVAPRSTMPPSPTGMNTLRANGDHFELDGKPFQIISGAIHSSRVPRRILA